MRIDFKSLVLALSILLTGCVALTNPADDINALMGEGQQLYFARRFDEAIARYRAVSARDPAFYGAYLGIARASIGKGAWSDAVLNARRAFELNPGAPDVLPVLLEALLGGGNDALARESFVDSIGYFSEYLRHQPSNFAAWLAIGKAYWQSGAIRDALSAFRRVLELNPRDSEALNFLQGR